MISTVQEYSILYTERVVQKDKRWADGILKHYEFNNKIEIFSEDGILVKSDFNNIKFDIGKQYIINKTLVEVLSHNGKFDRELTIKRENEDNKKGVSIKTGNEQFSSSIKVKTEPAIHSKKNILRPMLRRPQKLLHKHIKTKQNPQPKVEPKVDNPKPKVNNPKPKVDHSTPTHQLSAEPSIYNKSSPDPSPNPTIDPIVNPNTTTKVYINSNLPRIPKGSTLIYKHLNEVSN